MTFVATAEHWNNNVKGIHFGKLGINDTNNCVK